MTDAPSVHDPPREIEALIPHRWPFLLVDRIVEYDAGGEADRRDQGRHRDRVVLPGPLPGPAGHARRAPGGGARPDDGRLRRQAARASATGSGCSPASTSAASSASSSRATRSASRSRWRSSAGRFGRGRGVASVDGEVACEATLSASSSRAKASFDDRASPSSPTSTATRPRSRRSARRSSRRGRTSSSSPATSS